MGVNQLSDEEIELEESAAIPSPEWNGPYAFRAFRHRNFALLWTGQLISLTGTWMQGLALPFLVYHLTGSKSLLGIVSAASLMPAVFVTLPAGVWADRFSKRAIVMVTQSVLLLQASTLAALTFTGHIRPWHIVSLGALAGFANSIDMPTRQSMVVELVGKDDLQNAVALNSSMFNLTRIAGPFVGGIVYAAVGPAWCFCVNSVSYLGAIIGLFMMRNVRSKKRASRSVSITSQIHEGLSYVWSVAVVRDMLLMTAISQLFMMAYGIFFPVYATHIFHVGTKGQGMMSGAVGVGALSAAIFVSSVGHRYEKLSLVFTGAVLAPLGLIGFALSPTFVGCLLSLITIGVGMMLFMASSNTIMQVCSPAGLGGRVMSLRALVMFSCGAIGSYAMGMAAEIRHLDVEGTLLIGAIVTLCSSIYFVVSSRSSRAVPDSIPASEETPVTDEIG